MDMNIHRKKQYLGKRVVMDLSLKQSSSAAAQRHSQVRQS